MSYQVCRGLSVAKPAGTKGNEGEQQLCGQTEVLEITQNILRYATVDWAMIILAIRLQLDHWGGLYLDKKNS